MTTKQWQNVYRRKVEEIERLHKENAKLSERLEAGQKAKYALHNDLANLRIQNAELREQVEHLIGMIEQLEGDLAHFATIEAFEGKKEAQP